MNKDRQINAVAMAMQMLISAIDEAVTRLIGSNQHNIVLVIGCADVSQYGSNMKRGDAIPLLKDLLTRWQVGMDDVLPGEVTPGNTAAFEYLLRQVEEAAKHPDPASLDHASRRGELLAYVGRLEAKAKRGAA